VFLVTGKSADGEHQKPEKAPSVAGGAFSGWSTLVSSARNQQAIRRKRSPWWSMRLIEACSYCVYGGKTLRRQRQPLGVAEYGWCAGTSTLLWRMIRLLGQNAGLFSNALAVGMSVSCQEDTHAQQQTATIPDPLLRRRNRRKNVHVKATLLR
jgi:hypothetical protein